MKKIFYFLTILPLLGRAQTSQTLSNDSTVTDNEAHGIQWTEGLSWQEVKKKQN